VQFREILKTYNALPGVIDLFDAALRDAVYVGKAPLAVFPLFPVAALARHNRLFHRVHDPPLATSGPVWAPLPDNRGLDVFATLGGHFRRVL
jgi:hypothetical protein